MPRLLGLGDADEQSKECLSLFMKGKSFSQIDKEMKLRPGTAHQKVVGIFEEDSRRWNAPSQVRHVRRFDDMDRERICAMYTEGKTIREIMHELDASDSAIRYVLRNGGLLE